VIVPEVREAGDAGLLLQLDERIDAHVNARVVAIAAALTERAIPGVRDILPTYRSVAVHFDPLATDVDALRGALLRACAAPVTLVRGKTVEVPVAYGGEYGPDLGSVAALSGLAPAEVVERHQAVPYRVFMMGFLPGFPYLGLVDDRISIPRRTTPRLRVPAGSVGIAGRQTGIYPRESPGGWQIIGRTPLRMFDVGKTPAALLSPGDEVRFMSMASPAQRLASPHEVLRNGGRRVPGACPASSTTPAARHVTVIRPGLFTTVQDTGRWGSQASGVSVAGALDLVSHRIANALVGNDRFAATLEATLSGPELRIEQPTTIAVAGADLGATLDGTDVPLHVPVRCDAGRVLRFGSRRAGARAYVAFDGGVDVAPVLGSRATHVLCAMGGLEGRVLSAGDRLRLASAQSAPARRMVELPRVIGGGGARLRVLPGPQDEFFSSDAVGLLQRTRFTITPHSDRMGYRLAGGRIPCVSTHEMISDATFSGGLQIPASGEPILLLGDRQTTGGYPQIVTVISADLPLAAQLSPGDWIEFEICQRSEALAALIAQEGKLLAIG
jgi:antagonist of KipI